MKDNTLLIILCIILIIIVLYYIFKKCNNNNEYFNKVDISKFKNTNTILNRKNEQMKMDLFQNTDTDVFNINELLINNNINLTLLSGDDKIFDIINNRGKFEIISPKDNTTDKLFIFKFNYLKIEEITNDINSLKDKWSDESKKGRYPSRYNRLGTAYRNTSNNCSQHIHGFIERITNHYESYQNFMYSPNHTINVGTPLDKGLKLSEYVKTNKIIPTNKNMPINIINDIDSNFKFISTYKNTQFHYKNIEKTYETIWTGINEDISVDTGCGVYDASEYRTIFGIIDDTKLNDQTLEINDIMPYKFEDFSKQFNDAIDKYFFINSTNTKLVTENSRFNLQLLDNDNDVLVISYANRETKILSLTNFNKNETNYDNNIVIGVIIPIGKQVNIKYRELDRYIIEPSYDTSKPRKFADSPELDITLTESTLYLDRVINSYEEDTTEDLNILDYYETGRKRTKRSGINEHIKSTLQAAIKDLIMPSMFRYIDKIHAKKKHIKITNIELIDDINEEYLDYNGSDAVSSFSPSIEVCINCHDLQDIDNILIQPVDTDIFVNLNLIDNNIITFEEEDIKSEDKQFKKNKINITKITNDDGTIVKYYTINTTNNTNYKLYIINPSSSIVNIGYFIIIYDSYNNEFKYLIKNNVKIELTNKYNHTDKDKYLFNLIDYTKEESFQNTIIERFDTTLLDEYENNPIIISVDNSIIINVEDKLRTNIFKYISGIYTSDRYLVLDEHKTIKNENDKYILTNPKIKDDLDFDEQNKRNKLYVNLSSDNRELTTITYEVEPNKKITEKTIPLQYELKELNTYENIHSITYGSYLLLKKNNDEDTLHCVFNNITRDYEFKWFSNNETKFYSLYKNGILQESYSPFFTIEESTIIEGKNTMIFAISNYRKYLEEYTGNNQLNNVLLDKFEGFDFMENKNTYYDKFDYYEIKNVFGTKLENKSVTTIRIDIDKIDMEFNKKPNNNIDFIYTINSEHYIINKDEKYKFYYEEDETTKNNQVYDILNLTINATNMNYMDNYIKKLEDLVGCLPDEKKNEIINDNIKVYTCSKDEGSLDTEINSIKLIKKQKEEITKKLINNINLYKKTAIKTIKQTIIPKQKELHTLIYENYKLTIEIEKMNYKLQNKIQFSFNISTNEEYLKYIKLELQKLENNKNELILKREKERKNNYQNLQKVDECILKINKNINNINYYLEGTRNIREQFYQSQETGQLPKNTTINGINGLTKTIETYNNTIKWYFDLAKGLTNIVKEKVNIKYKLLKEIELNDNINLYYKNLSDIMKNKQLSNNDYMYSDEFGSLAENNYMKILGNLVIFLDRKKIELQTKLNKTKEKHLDTKQKLRKNKLLQVDYKVSPPEIASIEMDIILLYNEINDLKNNISNDYLLQNARYKLKQIQKLNLKVKDEGLSKLNVLEQFVSSSKNEFNKRFNTIQSHNNSYLSVLPNNYSNEYKININGKCLSSYNSKDYNLQNCENKKPQYFEPRLIDSDLVSETINRDNVNDNNIKYPYYQMVSSLSRDCLEREGDEISITPCSSNNKNQRWNLIENEVKCIDN